MDRTMEEQEQEKALELELRRQIEDETQGRAGRTKSVRSYRLSPHVLAEVLAEVDPETVNATSPVGDQLLSYCCPHLMH
ncbi:hypothetical protein ACLKA7_003572 [Drosophila subpalustris]